MSVVTLLVLIFQLLQSYEAQAFACCYGDIKLSGGSVMNEGRVEFCRFGQWITLCDTNWSGSEAQVVCKQLGYSHQGAVALTRTSYGQVPDTSAAVEYVRCDGTEERLIDCTIRGAPVSSSQCTHSGVRCVCRNGSLRLQGSNVQGSGRVEVCIGNIWGTVCDNSWSEVNARVVCKQLGFPAFGARHSYFAAYGHGSGPVHLSSVRCTGSESSLINCSYSTNHPTCTHGNDAAVQCQASPACYDGEVRLVDGRQLYEGRVEVCLNETWGKICDQISIYAWNVTEAEVVCKQLGYTRAQASTHSFGEGSVLVTIRNIQCRGSESSLAECVYTTSQNTCSRDEHGIIGVQCAPEDILKNGKLRLTDGLSRYEGRVEMYWSLKWTTICDDGWGEADAQVVCRQLNYLSTSVEVKAISYGQGYRATSTLLTNVGCTGSENNLTSCCATRIPDVNLHCHSGAFAGVRCAQCIENSIQLTGELSQNEGFVAICLRGSWGKVCGGNTSAAKVVCRQLGFSMKDPLVYVYPCFFDLVSGLPFVMANVQCTSHETQLSQCNYEQAGIVFCDDIFGIKCQLTEQNIPGVPVNVQVSSITSSSIGLSWSPPLVSETLGLIIYSYIITCSMDAQSHSSGIKTTDAHSTTFSQLQAFTAYNCCVAANSNNGKGQLACLNAVTAPIDTAVDYHAVSSALAVFFVMVSLALIATMALLLYLYLHHKQCTSCTKKTTKYESPVEKPIENPAYEYVHAPSESDLGHTSENLPYEVTVIGASESNSTESPAEYLMPSNSDLITCNQCIEHGKPTESIFPSTYQQLVPDTKLTTSPLKFGLDTKAESSVERSSQGK